MEIYSIDAELLMKCFIAGAKNLENNKEYINQLNVFPVPDGDTGTNMTMTIMSAAKGVSELQTIDMENVCKAISGGSLRGARGNSGVILSQLLRGFCKIVKTENHVDAAIAAKAFRKSVETAYKAVMKPKEGTILTVAKGLADKIEALSEENTELITLLDETIKYGDEVLAQTPEMLPVLKEAGVVDSGGEGLMTLVKGIYKCLNGEEIVEISTPAAPAFTAASIPASHISTDDIKFGYCTEFIINTEGELSDEAAAELRAFLESIGDSVVLVVDEGMAKVHVHTNHPGTAFEKGLSIGSLSKMKVDNLHEEHQEKLIKDAQRLAEAQAAKAAEAAKLPHKETAFITVAAGDELVEIFKGLGADYVISGGQTMNPSTEDMLNAIDYVNADSIFILPNNKNIILAAEQAAKICKDSKVFVVPTKTIPQGITALVNYTESEKPEDCLEAMKESLQTVKSGEITYAVRNTSINGTAISEGDIMGMGDNSALVVSKDITETAVGLVKALTDEESMLITLYSGADVEDAAAGELAEKLRAEFPGMEVDLEKGGQPVYYYFVSVE